MKSLSRLSIVLLLFVTWAVGCGPETKVEHSEVLHEDAVIIETVYTPSSHEPIIEPSFGGSGMIGFGPSGVGMRIGSGIQISSSEVPEQFAVVFRCQHGKFIVRKKAIYQKLKGHENQKVDVAYQEIYRDTYEEVNGVKKVTNRVLTGYHFIDATLK
ncbi:MAG: hypothetical protein PHF35_03560 [Candidatus Moranbacteria bacterium]|nr:hypothetical protein [Candidatus Moranbacteria bacterium]